MTMPGRRGRPLEATADRLIEISPTAIYLWLLRTVRMANPNPEIHTQYRFGELLGHDGTFVSHVESGRRSMPAHLRQRWMTLIGLSADSLNDYLVAAASSHPSAVTDVLNTSDEATAYALVDQALDGEVLTPREWTIACGVAGSIRLPRTIHRFARLAIDAMATTGTPNFQIMLSALHQLPDEVLVNAAREAVAAAPCRGNQVADLLGGVEAAYSGPVLRSYLLSIPDPWMGRGVVGSVRRLIGRGHLAAVADVPVALQNHLVDSMPGATSWMTRVELANLVRVLGPIPEPLRRRLIADPDPDVRLAAGERPADAALGAVSNLRQHAVNATLDHMYGSATSDPLADKLVGLIFLGRTGSERTRAAQALALSPYHHRCSEILTRTAHTSTTALEVRRAACLALSNFGASHKIADVLTELARNDPVPSIRAGATWSLTAHQEFLPSDFAFGILGDREEIVRSAAVDLAVATNSKQTLRAALAGNDSHIVEKSKFYLSQLPA